MGERILFADNIEFLLDAEYTLIDAFDFGDDIGHAVVVDAEQTPASILQEHEAVIDAQYNIEFTLDIAPDAVDGDTLAEMEDYRGLHDFGKDAVGDGSGETVVAMDSGVDTSHPAFEGVKIEKHDFTGSSEVDVVGHGTAVLGQVTRAAPNADLIMLRVFGDKGRASLRTILRAYKWVLNHPDKVDVLNMSLGTSQTVPQLNKIHNKLAEKDIKTVVSAGNSGGPSGSPATASTAYSVGATTDDGEMASFSSYNPNGENPEVVGIGKNNRLAKSKNASMGQNLDGRWVKASGTSFSAPLIAGFVARLLSADVNEPRKKLANTASDLTGTARDGQGLVKYGKAAGGDNGKEGESVPETSASVWEFAGSDSVFLNADWLNDGNYTVEKATNGQGEVVLTFEPADQNA